MDRSSDYAEFTGMLLSIDGGEAMPLHSVWVLKHYVEVRRRGLKVSAARPARVFASLAMAPRQYTVRTWFLNVRGTHGRLADPQVPALLLGVELPAF